MNHRWTNGPQPRKGRKPTCQVTGEDGNVFNLIGAVRRCMTEAGMLDEAKEMTARVMSASSYNEALNIFSEYVELE